MPVSQPDIQIRPYQEGDECDIVEMFGNVFSRELSLEEWRWKFAENPYAPPLATVAYVEEQLVGHYTMMPVRLNVMGRAVDAAQSIDTMVSPLFRGQQIFKKTATDCYQRYKESGGKCVFGFPNEQSYPGFMRRLQWKRISYLTEYSLRLGVSGVVEKWLPRTRLANVADHLYRGKQRASLALQGQFYQRQKSYVNFKNASTVPEGMDSFWKKIRSYAVFSVWKDSQYFSWRYDQNPKSDMRYAYLVDGEEIVALAVYRMDDTKAMHLMELLVADFDVKLGRLLLSKIAKIAVKEGKDTLVFVGHDAGFYDALFREWTSQPAFGFVLCARAFGLDELQDMFVQPGNWTMTLGDIDIF
ncbi:MAG TPA: hypothetical protein DCE42_17510 [Myxococcales bacterium]|nr:hypothetical protein [Deltaproteobacteria bacterium]HAA56565.1 hypothetical protein [Myxococcales bacterium]|tara:strand:+ start:10517 stop:11587 length:1071 start_codon:yes stop_codon:yes gene_type:complete